MYTTIENTRISYVLLESEGDGVGVLPQSLNLVNQTTDTVASSVWRKTDTTEVAESTRTDYKTNAYIPATSGNDGFQVVTKKTKNKAVIGTSRNSTMLQAAKNRHSSVFLSRLSPEPPVITSRTLQKLL